MKYALRAACVLVAAALLLAPTPTRAAAVGYADPAGDATRVGRTDLPRSSDPELDLIGASWSTTSDELVIRTSLTAMGAPLASDGWAVAHYFDYEGIAFEVLVQDVGTATAAAIGPDGVYLRLAGDSPPPTEFPCVCGFTMDTERAQMTLRVELHSLGSAAKFVDPSLPRPSAGSQFTDLHTISYRVAGVLLAADDAVAPEGTVLVV